MAYLYRIRADGTEIERWELGEAPLVMGRGETADAYVEDDALSRSHFLITREGAEYCLIDLKSRNGTWVNGERVSAHKLRPNEIIQAGESLFGFSEVPVAVFVIPALAVSSRVPDPARVRVQLS
jgi:pSer/pThr/pTyr-binding forkhead associated (FHA) protein